MEACYNQLVYRNKSSQEGKLLIAKCKQKAINDINNPAGNFAVEYGYFDNGNISKAQFYNPDISLLSNERHYHWNLAYDDLNQLTSAGYGKGSSGGSTRFDVTGLTYDDAVSFPKVRPFESR